MRIAFVDSGPLRYALDALERAPLGGTQSAMLVLARELAAAGAEVAVAGRGVRDGERHRGVLGVDLQRVLDGNGRLPDADFAVALSVPIDAASLAQLFERAPRVVHWHHNDALGSDAPGLARIAAGGHVARFVFCSHFQAGEFVRAHALPRERIAVIPNALPPAFTGLFAPGEPVLAAKDPELLAYTSAPNRGLEALAGIVFPELRRFRPRLRLEVYSGFYLDQGMRYVQDGRDAAERMEAILTECSATAGVSLHRGVPKPELAARLKRAALLCYPCTYRESAPLTALEAMAAGCLVSATDAGGLPEVCAGFARLTPFDSVRGYSARRFVANTLGMLAQRDRAPADAEERLRAQIAHARASHAPQAVAARWLELLRGGA